MAYKELGVILAPQGLIFQARAVLPVQGLVLAAQTQRHASLVTLDMDFKDRHVRVARLELILIMDFVRLVR